VGEGEGGGFSTIQSRDATMMKAKEKEKEKIRETFLTRHKSSAEESVWWLYRLLSVYIAVVYPPFI
jgi:hypothetical protein